MCQSPFTALECACNITIKSLSNLFSREFTAFLEMMVSAPRAEEQRLCFGLRYY